MNPLLSGLLKQVVQGASKGAMAKAGVPSVSSATAPGHLAPPDFGQKLWSEDGGYKSLFDGVRQRGADLGKAHDDQRAAMPPMSKMPSVAGASADAVKSAPGLSDAVAGASPAELMDAFGGGAASAPAAPGAPAAPALGASGAAGGSPADAAIAAAGDAAAKLTAGG